MLSDLRGSWKCYSTYKIVMLGPWRQGKHRISNNL